MLRLTILALLVAASAGQDCDMFRFANYYQDNMVLQQDPASVTVWGYASAAGNLVAVYFDDTFETVRSYYGADDLPQWSVKLRPTAAGGPHTITADETEFGCTDSIENVLFGDVYVCSGQSNMDHRLDNVDDPEPDIEDVVNYPDVRTMKVSLITADEPLWELPGIQREWALPTETNMPEFSAVCWFFGRNLNIQLGIPIGLIHSSWGGTRIEAWSSPEALYECFGDEGPPGGSGANEESVLWNSMIHPLLPMAIYGAIWYQGESNDGRPDDYYCSMPAMVNDWRARWYDSTDGESDPVFPFGQVQLAPDNEGDNENRFTNLRWAQAGYVGYCPNDVLERVFMAVAADLPDYDSPHGSIHPRYKRQISERLALGAFALGYGLEETTGRYQGPFPTSITQDAGEVVVEFDDGQAELEFRDTEGFELCCSPDGDTLCPDNGATWVRVDITTQGVSDLRLNIACAEDESITGLRYIWRESPCDLEECAVYSVDNDLPAPPYKYEGLISAK